MTYRLRDLGYPWKTICKGREHVGRVFQHATTKKYHGIIGPVEATGDTPAEAFHEVVARDLGFANAKEWWTKSRKLLAEKKVRQHKAGTIAKEFLAATTMDGRFAALDKLESLEDVNDALSVMTKFLSKPRR